MARKKSAIFKNAFLIILIIGGSWAVQNWMASEEIVEINGKRATIIDGDSFKAADEEFRIYGIDAPEYRQTCSDSNGTAWTCGKFARTGLEEMLRTGAWACTVRARDRFGRNIVICADENRRDLGSTLVRQGFAVSGLNFDEAIYASEEDQAKNVRKGIWRGAFVRPEVWRKQHPRGS
ncbi:thermonuclease family protein [Parasphingorhabdus sp.]|uniref:thermonuclease family protein n=1 Tax=Parasphingorhabdus sp. TaxID=2709688 RepID=UPI003266CE9D